MVVGNVNEVVNATRLKIYRGTQEIALATTIDVTNDVPNTRISTKAGPIDAFNWRRIEVAFTAQLTEDLVRQIQTDITLDNRTHLGYNAWRIEGLAVSGSSGDDISESVTAAVIHFSYRTGADGLATANIKLLVTGSKV